MSAALEAFSLVRTFHFQDVPETVFSSSCTGRITSVPLSSTQPRVKRQVKHHRLHTGKAFVVDGLGWVVFLFVWVFLSKGGHEIGILPAYLQYYSSEAADEARFQFLPALVPVSTVCRQ